MWGSVKSAIGDVAPFLGAALGGPFGGVAGEILSKILTDKPNSSPDDVLKGLLTADPDKLLALKQAEMDFQVRMESLKLDSAKLEQQSQASARERDVALAQAGVKDRMTPILAGIITTGFFTLVYIVLFHPIPTQIKELAYLLIGAIITSWQDVVGFYFGSSLGSTQKNSVISKLTNR